MTHPDPLQAVQQVFDTCKDVAIAVSGGVDSMTLAHLAHRHFGIGARFFHAISPAVPAEATERVKAHARLHNWQLTCLDAGEFADERYLRNPVDRCYYCKSHLYDRIAEQIDGVIFSGANIDDLDDYRPGLHAARERGIRHPFIEAGIGKTAIRAVARGLGLTDLAELPASPCLASRIETRIAIASSDLAVVDTVERTVRSRMGPVEIRCRIVAAGVRLELSDEALERFRQVEFDDLRERIAMLIREAGKHYVGAVRYRRGSAFLQGAVHE